MYDKQPFLPVGSADECLAGWEQIVKVLGGLEDLPALSATRV
jgi:hypothetical protein